jgi:hypothetical protein
VRAYTRLSEAAKALSTRDHVRGISGPSTLLSTRGRAGVVLSIRRGGSANPAMRQADQILRCKSHAIAMSEVARSILLSNKLY